MGPKTGVESAFSRRNRKIFSFRDGNVLTWHLHFAKTDSKAWRWIALRTFGNCSCLAMLTTSLLIKRLSFCMMLIRPNYQQYYPFNLDGIDSAECKAEFHVEKADLPRLPEALQLPPTFHCQQWTAFDSMEGLRVLFKRVSYPCRYSDTILRFGRPVSVFKPWYNKSHLRLHLRKPRSSIA